MQILNQAKDYVYITTPHRILDDSMVSAPCPAAKSGVDVRIITPQVWDKNLIHMATQSYYRELTQGGVKIYEYTGDFIHSKTFVSETGSPALERLIWTFGVCIFILNAAFGCATTVLFYR